MDDATAMRRALALSRAVLGTTSPNPPVGAVVLDHAGEVVGEGATQPPGGPHAEVVALRQAGERARGGTVVVTLEPCTHTGRTPPCTDAVLAAGVRRVVVGAADPTEQAGGGADLLSSRDVDTTTEFLVDEVTSGPLEAWLASRRTGRPFVTWKAAATLDGRSAAADGTSRWITGEAARADVHRLRGEVDAVVVGVGSVLADDPQLTVRTDPPPARQPLRVVVDSRRRTPAGARVLDSAAPTVRAVVGARPGDGDDVLALPPGADGRVDLPALLAGLQGRGVVSVLLEGGPVLAAAFLRAGLVDRAVVYVAPALLGAGPAAVADLGAGTIEDAMRLRLEDVVRVGDDVRITTRRP